MTANARWKPGYRGEEAAHAEHHRVGDEHAERGADEGSDEVVGRSLVEEHLHQVAATGTDRAGDAELAAPLGCEQDEDQEDQQNPRGDRERAERREERDDPRSEAVRRVQRVLLGLVGFEAERAHRWVQRFDDLVGRGDAATVGDVDSVDQARFVEQRLRARQRHRHSVVGGERTLVVDHRADTCSLEAGAGEDADRVPGLRAERVGELRIQEDLVRPELRERHRLAGCAHRAEGAKRGRIAGEERYVRLVLRPAHVLDGAAPNEHRRHRTHEPRGAPGSRDPLDVALWEVAGSGADGADRERSRQPFRADNLIGPAEHRDRRGADRGAHRVPGRKRSGDDRRPEHQPSDDQSGTTPPAPGIPDAEAEEHAIAQREHRNDREQHHHEHREHFRERAHRDPEQLLHGSPNGGRRLRDHDVVRLATRRCAVEHHVGQLLDLGLVEAAHL